MKLNVSKLVAGGLLAVALPLLSACYATVGTDGRTYLTPMGYGSMYSTSYAPNYSLGYGYSTVSPYAGYQTTTPQGYTYYTPSSLGMSYTTIPATTTYTSYPIVSRKIVGTSDTCVVRPKPRKSCK